MHRNAFLSKLFGISNPPFKTSVHPDTCLFLFYYSSTGVPFAFKRITFINVFFVDVSSKALWKSDYSWNVFVSLANAFWKGLSSYFSSKSKRRFKIFTDMSTNCLNIWIVFRLTICSGKDIHISCVNLIDEEIEKISQSKMILDHYAWIKDKGMPR